MEKEIRQLTTNIELRAPEGDTQGNYIEGYALKFEKWSERLWDYFKEIISQNALDNTDMSNVVATFNHEANFPLARNTIAQGDGALELSVDNIGLHFRFKPTNTSYGQDLIENIRSGVINQCSFAFSIDYNDDNADEWTYNNDEGIYERRINNISRLYDISIVTTPAYSDTEAVVGQRSKDKVQELEQLRKKPNEDIVKRDKFLFELDLLDLEFRGMGMGNDQNQACIDACNDCLQAAEECLTQCLQESDVADREACINALRDCIDCCSICTKITARGSACISDVCGLCASICETCAKECEKFDDDHCKKCAEACNKCMEVCQKMA